MHHNKHVETGKQTVSFQTTVVKDLYGNTMELNRHDRRKLKIRGGHVVIKTKFNEKRDL